MPVGTHKGYREEERPPHLTGGYRSFSPDDIRWIVDQFAIGDVAEITVFEGKGNINLNTYQATTADGQEYLLQRLNTDVFCQPYRVMNSMIEWIDAQRRSLAGPNAPRGTVWEPITLVPTKREEDFLDISDPSGWSIWRMMRRIGDTVTYKSLSEIPDRDGQLRLAEEIGRGLALSADLTAGMPVDDIVSSLPGYRDTRGYYQQFHSVLGGCRSLDDCADRLPEDGEIRESTQMLYLVAQGDEEFESRLNDPQVREMVQCAIDGEDYAMRLQQAAADGHIRRTAIHGDTKIDNFLFCRHTGSVRCLIDLDTIMPYTWLADWGDMMRSLSNVAGEKERDPERVQVDRDVYEAVARGFLKTAKQATPEEIDLMVDAVPIIALELGIRFLADYLRGDNYFQLAEGDAPDLNKVRAQTQLTLYRRLMDQREWARECVARCSE